MAGGPAETVASDTTDEDREDVGAASPDVTGDNPQLTEVQNLFVRLLLEGLSMDEISERCGRTRRQLYRWREKPAIRDELRRGFADGLFRARAVLSTNAVDAANALASMAKGTSIPDAPRTAAARSVIELATKLGEYAGDAAAVRHDVHVGGGISIAGMNSEQRAKRRAELEAKVRKAKADRDAAGAPPDGSGDGTA
jgi:hypothetical protein